MPNGEQTFHIDQLGRFALVGFLPFAPAFWVAWGSISAVLAVLLVLIIATLLTYFVSTVVVGPDGIVLYRIHRAEWSDFTTANRKDLLGLPYLIVQRREGNRWWIPLYLAKLNEFHLAVATNAPVGNPVREYVDTYS